MDSYVVHVIVKVDAANPQQAEEKAWDSLTDELSGKAMPKDESYVLKVERDDQ